MSDMVLLAESRNKKVYRQGNKIIKLFAKDFPKSEVLHEALATARVEETGLPVGRIEAVSVVDGCWALTKDYVEGETLYDRMMKEPEKVKEYLSLMVDIQIEINKKNCPLLGSLKQKMIRDITKLEEIDESTRYDLLTRLNGMPKHRKLCHGDLDPKNIILNDKGEYAIIDWVHAAEGNASADAARSYLLLVLMNEEWADLYLDLFCEKTNTKRSYVENWLPLVAAAQMVKHRPEEAELLRKWVNVVEYI